MGLGYMVARWVAISSFITKLLPAFGEPSGNLWAGPRGALWASGAHDFGIFHKKSRLETKLAKKKAPAAICKRVFQQKTYICHIVQRFLPFLLKTKAPAGIVGLFVLS